MAETANANPEVQRVVEILNGMRFCMITTVNAEGEMHSRPMTVQRVEENGDLWFFIERNCQQAQEIEAHPGVNVAFSGSSSWVSVAGNGELVDDRAQINELWNSWVEAWFPKGPEDPNLTLLKVNANSAEYWDSPGGRLASVISFVKAKVTGDAYQGGDNAAVDLPS